MKITFLLGSAYGMGGTIRATVSLANHLAARHEIEIITLHRWRSEPFFSIDDRQRAHADGPANRGASRAARSEAGAT
jgi:hypothetical protein